DPARPHLRAGRQPPEEQRLAELRRRRAGRRRRPRLVPLLAPERDRLPLGAVRRADLFPPDPLSPARGKGEATRTGPAPVPSPTRGGGWGRGKLTRRLAGRRGEDR